MGWLFYFIDIFRKGEKFEIPVERNIRMALIL